MSAALVTTTKPELGPITLDLRGVSQEDLATVSEILREIKGATERVVKAARRWVEMPEEVRERVVRGSPATLRDVWHRLERIGMGQMHPLLWGSYGHNANLLARLPLQDQERYLAEKIPVAVVSSNGRPDIQRIALEDLGATLRLQVFKSAGRTVQVRTVAEQRAWLAEQQRRRELEEERDTGITRIDRPGRWKVEKNRVWVDPAKLETGLTLKDLAQMMRDLKV